MSYTFYIEADRPPFFSELLNAFPQLSLLGEKPARDVFVVNHHYQVYEDCVSVRSLEIKYSIASKHLPKSSISVRVMIASSRDDYELSLAISGYFVELYGSNIWGEDSDPMNFDNFKEQFGDNWTNQMVLSGPQALRIRLTEDSEGPITLSGPRRFFYFGMKSLKKIDSDNEITFVENYFKLAKDVQYIDVLEYSDKQYYAANILKIQTQNSTNSSDFIQVCVWAPGISYLFPAVKFLLLDDGNKNLIVPIALLKEFTKVNILDDHYCTAERVEKDKWDDVIGRAKVAQIAPSTYAKTEKKIDMTIETALTIVKSPSINMDELETVLNALSHEDRLVVTRKFTPKIQKNLFAAAEGRPVSVEQIVPSTSTLEEVIHEGTNTIPIFRTFQKRFARPVKSENRDAIGYNHNWYGALTAPGYFVCDQDESNGEFVIDYTQLPTEKADSWPKIISNNSMLGFLIWSGMKDRLRRVSDHVTIGRAYKKKPMNAYFTLCRVD